MAEKSCNVGPPDFPVCQKLLSGVAVLVNDLHLLQDGRLAALGRPEQKELHLLKAFCPLSEKNGGPF
jgi:hypothetical protein